MPCGSSNYECSSGQGASLKTLLFATIEGSPLSPNAQSAAGADFADGIDMPDVTFHALRHTHASQLIDAGVDIVTISKRLGHAKPDITLRVCAHLFGNDDSKAAAAIDAPLAGRARPDRTISSAREDIEMAQSLIQALGNAEKQRNEAKTPEARQEVIASQITDALLGIQWMLVSIADSMNRMERN